MKKFLFLALAVTLPIEAFAAGSIKELVVLDKFRVHSSISAQDEAYEGELVGDVEYGSDRYGRSALILNPHVALVGSGLLGGSKKVPLAHFGGAGDRFCEAVLGDKAHIIDAGLNSVFLEGTLFAGYSSKRKGFYVDKARNINDRPLYIDVLRCGFGPSEDQGE